MYPLRLSAILDSGTTLHIFNDLTRFKTFRKAIGGEAVIAGASEVLILGFGGVDLEVILPGGEVGMLRLRNATYCTDFNTNLVSF